MKALVLDFPEEKCGIPNIVLKYPKLTFSRSMLCFCGKIIELKASKRSNIYIQISEESTWRWYRDWIRFIDGTPPPALRQLSRFKFVFD